MLRLAKATLLAAVIATASPALAASLEEHVRNPEPLLKANCPGDSLLLPKRFYTICYQPEWRIARWVAYYLSRANIDGDTERTNDFREDPDIEDEEARSKLKDYRSSNYARGHQAPAEDFSRSLAAMSSTFLLSNMAPQTAQLNSGKWRVLESQARKATDAHRGAWIFTGSLFATERGRRCSGSRTFEGLDPMDRPRSSKTAWAKGRVAVPTHSFKAVLTARDSGRFVAHGFIMPNQRRTLAGDVLCYQVSVDEIERLVDIDFFAALDKDLEDRLEADVPAWPPTREARK